MPVTGEYMIINTNALNNLLVLYGIVELLGEGTFLECDKLRDEIRHELNCAILN